MWCFQGVKKKISDKKWVNNLFRDDIYPVSYFLFIPINFYLFKVNHRNTRKRCEICSKLSIKTPERRQWPLSGIFIANFKLISNIILVFPLWTLNRFAGILSFFILLSRASLFNPLTTNVPHHIETSQLICIANQLTGFYIMGIIGC